MAWEKIIDIIQSKKETESGFFVPRRMNGEIISDHMNFNIFNIDSSIDYGRGGNDRSEMFNTVREQYMHEKLNGNREIRFRNISSNFSNLVLAFRLIDISSTNYMRLVANIWNRNTNEFQNEYFEIDIKNEQAVEFESANAVQVEIKSHEVCFLNATAGARLEDLYVVLRLYTFEKMTRTAGELKIHSIYEYDEDALRRPYGCAVLSLPTSKMYEMLNSGDVNPSIPLTCNWVTGKGKNEKLFATLHEKIVGSVDEEFSTESCELPFKMTIHLYMGSSTDQSNENIFRVHSTRVAPIINVYPDPVNDTNKYYVTLVSGEFSNDSKTSGKNIEIKCFLVDGDGNVRNSLKTCKSVHELSKYEGYTSTVYYHNFKPIYNETFFINIDELGDEIYLSHILFLMYHCSSKESSNGNVKDKRTLFGFSVLMLGDIAGGISTPIEDSTFTLPCYHIPAVLCGKDIREYRSIYFDENVVLKSRVLRRSLNKSLTMINESITITMKLLSWCITNDTTLNRLLNPHNYFSTIENDGILAGVYEDCLLLSDGILLKYFRRVMDQCFKSIMRTQDSSEPAFRLLVRLLHATDNCGFGVSDTTLKNYIEKAFFHQNVYEKLLFHIDASLLWMRYPTLSPNRRHISAMLQTIDSIMQLAHKSVQITNHINLNQKQDFQCLKYSLRLDLSNFRGILENVLHTLNNLMSLENMRTDWLQELQFHVMKKFPILLDFALIYLDWRKVSTYVQSFISNVVALIDQGKMEFNNFGDVCLFNVINSIAASSLFNQVFFRDCVSDEMLLSLEILNKKGKNITNIIKKIVCELYLVCDTESDVVFSQKLFVLILQLLYDDFIQLRTGTNREVHPFLHFICPNMNLRSDGRKLSNIRLKIHLFFGILDVIRFDGMKNLINGTAQSHQLILKMEFVLLMMMQNLYSLYLHCFIAVQLQVIKGVMRALHVLYTILAAHSISGDFEVIQQEYNPFSSSILLSKFQPRSGVYLWLLAIEISAHTLSCPLLYCRETLDLSARRDYVRVNFAAIRKLSLPLFIEMWENIWAICMDTELMEALMQLLVMLMGSTDEIIRNSSAGIFVQFMIYFITTDKNVSFFFDLFLKTVVEIFQHCNYKTCLHNEEETLDYYSKYVGDYSRTGRFGTSRSFSSHHFEQFLNMGLRDFIESKPELQECKNDFMKIVDEAVYFIQLVGKLSICVQSRSNSHEVMTLSVKVIDFFGKHTFSDVYFSFLHSLVTEYCKNSNFLEASYLLSIHAKVTELSNDRLNEFEYGFHEIEVMPATRSWKRRLHLLEEAIALSEKASAWERCLGLIDSLIEDVHLMEGNHEMLKKYLMKQIEILDRSFNSSRLPLTFFMVCYYGDGFDLDLRNKKFVYHRPRGETLKEFASLLRSNYDDFTLLKQNQDPYEFTMNYQKSVRIVRIKPSNDVFRNEIDTVCGNKNNNDLKLLEARDKRQSINDSTKLFEYKICCRKDPSIGDEFLDLWVTKHFVFTDIALPSYVYKSNVIEVTTTSLNPIEVATDDIDERILVLLRGIREMKDIADCNDKFASQKITMELSGTIDAAVNGGISKYDSILSRDYRWKNPSIDEEILRSGKNVNEILEKFKTSFQKLIILIGKAVEIHKRKVCDDMRALHEHLERSYFNVIMPNSKEHLSEKIDCDFCSLGNI